MTENYSIRFGLLLIGAFFYWGGITMLNRMTFSRIPPNQVGEFENSFHVSCSHCEGLCFGILLLWPEFFPKTVRQDVLHGKVIISVVVPPPSLRQFSFCVVVLWLDPWPSRHSHGGMSSCWIYSLGVLVTYIAVFPFTKEHTFITWEGSYQSYVALGVALIGQGEKALSLIS